MSDARQFVGINDGLDQWAEAAFTRLLRTAARYNAVVIYSDLAEQIQLDTGLHTRAHQRNWIGKVLSVVVHRCQGEGQPPLTALVVHKHDGQVGPGYDEVLTTAGLQPIDDQLEREQHAARARLDCYLRYAVDLPPDPRPALTPLMSRAVERQAAMRTPVRRGAMCPKCFIETPATGLCPTCD